MSVRPEIPCPHCEGTGEIEMPPELSDTLRCVDKHGSTAEAIALRLPDEVGVTAISNRLLKLHQLELVTRIKSGRYWLYRRGK